MIGEVKAVATAWLAAKLLPRKLMIALGVIVGFVLVLWWIVRHPRYTLPPFFGLVVLFAYHGPGSGPYLALLVTVTGYGLVLYGWGKALLGTSEIDTWRELWYGLPRIRTVYRNWSAVMQLMASPSVTAGDAVPAIGEFRLSTTGVIATVDTSPVGKHVSVLKKHEFNIAAAFKADRVLFRNERNWISTVRIDWGAHLRREYTLADIPRSSNDTVWPYMVPFGIAESGRAAEILANEPILIGGVTGSGKSHTAWSILAGYIRLGVPIQVDVIDWSGTEFGFLKQFVGQGIIKSYIGGPDTDVKDIDRVMKQFLIGMKNRLAAMERKNIRLHIPTDKEPLRLLLVDEGLPISQGMRDQKFQHPLILIASQGRKANYVPLLNTQAAQKDVLGLFRDLTSTALSLRTKNRFCTEVVLGEGAEGDGAKCSYLDAEADKGVGYMHAKGGYQGFRSARVSDTDIQSIAHGLMPEAAEPITDDSSKPRITYALYNADNELLYIGQTRLDRGTPATEVELYTEDQLAQRAAENRMKEHRREQPWGNEIARTVVRGVYANKHDGLDAETLLILTEKPPYNIAQAVYNKDKEYA